MRSPIFSSPRTIPLCKGRIAIVASRWHYDVTQRLVQGALEVLAEKNTAHEVDLFWVEGAFELPQATMAISKTGQYVAIVPLGCLVRGETPHFDYIAQSVFNALENVGMSTQVAVSCGILTVENLVQANDRSGGEKGNKGKDAAMAALDLALVLEKLKANIL